MRDAQSVHPGDFWLNIEPGLVLLEQKDYEGAVRFNTAAVASRPSSAVAHVNLGSALVLHNKLDEAIACYRKAIELDPKDSMAHYTLGWALHEKGIPEGAVAEFRRAIELNPTDGEPTTALATRWPTRRRWTRPSPPTAGP